MSTLLTKTKVPSDVFIWEVDQRFCRVSAKIKNTTLAAVTLADPVGYPLKLVAGVWELALEADVATIDGVIVDGDPISALADAATTEREYAILARGPALLDYDNLPTSDVAGTAFTMATFVSSLAAIDVQVMQRSGLTSQQTE